jgi:Protein of unknown function (DUF3619)
VNENELARKIAARLDQDVADLPVATVRRLRDARMAALAAYSRETPNWQSRIASGAIFGRGMTARLMLPAAIVVAAITGLIYWQMSSHHEEELDTTGLLAGELPIHAYTDPGFETWLKHSNYAKTQP